MKTPELRKSPSLVTKSTISWFWSLKHPFMRLEWILIHSRWLWICLRIDVPDCLSLRAFYLVQLTVMKNLLFAKWFKQIVYCWFFYSYDDDAKWEFQNHDIYSSKVLSSLWLILLVNFVLFQLIHTQYLTNNNQPWQVWKLNKNLRR